MLFNRVIPSSLFFLPMVEHFVVSCLRRALVPGVNFHHHAFRKRAILCWYLSLSTGYALNRSGWRAQNLPIVCNLTDGWKVSHADTCVAFAGCPYCFSFSLRFVSWARHSFRQVRTKKARKIHSLGWAPTGKSSFLFFFLQFSRLLTANGCVLHQLRSVANIRTSSQRAQLKYYSSQ